MKKIAKKPKKRIDQKKVEFEKTKEREIRKIIDKYLIEHKGDTKEFYDLKIKPKSILPNGIIHQPYRFDQYKRKINRAFL